MRIPWWLVGLIVPFIATEPAVGVVALRATAATVATTGETADLCVLLDAGGEQVAGTQNDLVWDGSCATLARGSDCRVNPATGKSLFGTVVGVDDFRYRGLVLSLLDTKPLSDGQLYCCAFSVEARPGTCCPVEVVNVGASDPRGKALPSIGDTAQLCVAAGGGNASPTPTATPMFHADLASSASGGGCQILSPSSGHLGAGSCVGAALLALLLRRRWSTRERERTRSPKDSPHL